MIVQRRPWCSGTMLARSAELSCQSLALPLSSPWQHIGRYRSRCSRIAQTCSEQPCACVVGTQTLVLDQLTLPASTEASEDLSYDNYMPKIKQLPSKQQSSDLCQLAGLTTTTHQLLTGLASQVSIPETPETTSADCRLATQYEQIHKLSSLRGNTPMQ